MVQRGTMFRQTLEVMRKAAAPVTSREIALGILAAINVSDNPTAFLRHSLQFALRQSNWRILAPYLEKILHRFIGIVALLVLIGGGFYLVQSTEQNRNYNSAQPTVTKKQNGISRQTTASPTAKKKDEKGHEGSWYHTFLDHTPDWFVALFTAVLVGVTYLLVNATAGLRASTDKLWEAGERQMTLIATNAERQAQDAKASLDAFKIHSERQLRAYVTIQSANIRNLSVGGDPRALIIIKNTGQTPAYELTSVIGLRLIPAEYEDGEPVFPSAKRSKSPLGPGQEKFIYRDLGKTLAAPDLQGLIDGRLMFEIIGKVEYIDTFKKAQHTHFTFFYGGSYGANENGALYNGAKGNEAT